MNQFELKEKFNLTLNKKENKNMFFFSKARTIELSIIQNYINYGMTRFTKTILLFIFRIILQLKMRQFLNKINERKSNVIIIGTSRLIQFRKTRANLVT